MHIAILAAFAVALAVATTCISGAASAQDFRMWADYTARGTRTTGYRLVDGTNTPQVFVTREICDDQIRTLLSILQSLSADIHSIRCE
jgi:hypothetical protein